VLAAGLGLAAALAARPARAAPPAAVSASTMTVELDARVELLGVLQVLAGDPRRARELPSELAGLEARFAPFRGHPAVKSYAALVSDPARELRALSLLFHLSPPPELAERPEAPIPEEDAAAVGGAAAERELLETWRDFARVSGFMDDFARRREANERSAARVRAELARADSLRLVEDYAGPLDSRLHVVLSPVLRSGRFATIVPYPFRGGGARVAGPFEVFVLAEPDRIEDGEPVYSIGPFWNELLDVAVDPVLGERCEDVAALAGAQAPIARECPGEWFHCVTNLVKAAILERLGAAARGAAAFPPVTWPAGAYGDDGRAVARLLEDYEKRRAEYPTLRALYPRLVATLASLPRGPAPSAEEVGRMCGRVRGAASAPSGPAAPPAGPARGADELKRAGVWSLLHGRVEEALADFSRAAELAPDDAEARLDASVALERLGRAGEAQAAADAAVARAGASGALAADALSTRASLWAARGRRDEEREDLSAALAAAPADWPRRAQTRRRLDELGR